MYVYIYIFKKFKFFSPFFEINFLKFATAKPRHFTNTTAHLGQLQFNAN
jgi:hypothetical protein